MGQVMGVVNNVTSSVINYRIGEKRKKSSLDDDELELVKILHAPKWRKLECTAKYIYQALFIEGKDSDVTVRILNKDWKLHKVYLQQSKYFSSMFSGSWSESSQNQVNIEVGDPNITLESLQVVFGSLYFDEMVIEPAHVVSILASAIMFQLDELIDQCGDIMLENLSPLTALQYYQASCQYGLTKVKASVLKWYATNLLDYFCKHLPKLDTIDCELMLKIITHPDLCVVQTEMFLYALLKKWLYIRCNPFWEREWDHFHNACDDFFRTNRSEEDGAFLNTDEGFPYREIFRKIRIEHLLNHPQDLITITIDNIIPSEWLFRAYRFLWFTVLQISNGQEKGPEDMNEELFEKHCMRLGRIIKEGGSHSWRWTYHNFGISLIWSLSDGVFTVRRQRSIGDSSSGSNVHNILTRVEVVNLDEKRQIRQCLKSQLKKIQLAKNQEVKLLDVDSSSTQFPLMVTVRLLATSPTSDQSLLPQSSSTLL